MLSACNGSDGYGESDSFWRVLEAQLRLTVDDKGHHRPDRPGHLLERLEQRLDGKGTGVRVGGAVADNAEGHDDEDELGRWVSTRPRPFNNTAMPSRH